MIGDNADLLKKKTETTLEYKLNADLVKTN